MKKIAILLVAMLLALSLPLAFADSHEDAPADEGAGDEEDDAGDDEAGDEEEDEAGEEEEEEAGDCPEGFTCVDAICVDDARLECPDEAVVGDQRGGRKTTICHVPPGNPANRHTIVVGNAAVPAHLAHGDFLGACECEATDEEPLACSVDEEEEEDTEDDAGDEEDDAGDDEVGDEEEDEADEAGDEEDDAGDDEAGDETDEDAGDEEDDRELALLEEIRDLLREIRELLRGLLGGEE